MSTTKRFLSQVLPYGSKRGLGFIAASEDYRLQMAESITDVAPAIEASCVQGITLSKTRSIITIVVVVVVVIVLIVSLMVVVIITLNPNPKP